MYHAIVWYHYKPTCRSRSLPFLYTGTAWQRSARAGPLCQVHTFCLKYAPDTYFCSEVCTGMYHVHNPRKRYKICYILEEKNMYQVHTFFLHTSMYQSTYQLPVYDIFHTSGTASISFLKGTSVTICVLTSSEYILSVSDSFACFWAQPGLLEICCKQLMYQHTNIETNHTKTVLLLCACYGSYALAVL